MKITKKHKWIAGGVLATCLLMIAAVGLTRKKDAEDTTESELVSSETQSAEERLATQTPTPEKDIQISKVDSFELATEAQNTVTGFVVDFGKGVSNLRGPIKKKDLAGIQIEPNLAFEGTWVNSHTFRVDFRLPLKPEQRLKIQIAELPISEKHKAFLNEKAQWTVTLPKLQVEDLDIDEFSVGRKVQLGINWNFEVTPADLKDKLTVSYQGEDRSRPAKTFSGKRLSFFARSDKKQTFIRIRSPQLRGGTLSVKTKSPIIVRGISSTDLNFEEIQLIPPKKLEIRTVQAIQGKSGFTLEVGCKIDAPSDGRQYYYYQPKCELDPSEANRSISIQPKTNFSVVSGRGAFKLFGEFRPNTRYDITFHAGLTVNDQYILKNEVKKVVSTRDYKPSFSFQQKARYLPASTGADLSYEARNIDDIKVKVSRIYPQNLVFWLTKTYETPSSDVSDEIKNFEVAIGGEKNQKVTGTVSLDAFKPKGKGVYHISVQGKNVPNTSDFATVVVTDLGVIAKLEKNNVRVWTVSLDDLTPKAGVDATVLTYSNKEIGKCKTSGSEANCVIKNVITEKSQPFVIVLKSRDDLTYVKFTDLLISDDRIHAGTRPFSLQGVPLEGYVYSSRGVYRPGEIANIAAVVKTQKGALAKNLPIQWKIKSPKNKVIREIASQTDAGGLASFDFPTSHHFQTGKYSVELNSGKKQIGTYDFLLEDFVPERIAVKLVSEKPHYIAGEPSQHQIDAKFLFGPPVAGGAFTSRCTISPAFYKVPKNPKFSTGLYSKEPPRPILLEANTGKLNQKGIAKFNCDYAKLLGSNYPTVMQLKARADVEESGSGRVTSSTVTSYLGKSDSIIGLHARTATAKLIDVEGMLFDIQGKSLQKDEKLSYSVFRVESEWFYALNQWGGRSWEMEEVFLPTGEIKFVQAKQGRSQFQFKPPQTWGTYLIRARSEETGYTSDLKVSLGWSYWSSTGSPGNEVTPGPSAPGEIAVQVSKTLLKKGESFKASFQSPFDGRALISLETDRVHHSQWIPVKKGAKEVSLKAPNVLPNFYVSVLVVKNPKDATGGYVPGRAWGGRSITVSPEEYTLHVNVNTPKETRGDRELAVDISNKEKQSANYTVAVVDEGILQLTQFASPSPSSYFFEPRRLDVKLYDSIGWTYSKVRRGSEGGGSGRDPSAQAGNKVMPVKLVSYWSGVVNSDANGNAKVRVPLPPFQGKVRVMVVATSKGGKLGSADQNVFVRDPIVVQPTFPRFLSHKDKFVIPVAITNMTGNTANIKVRLESNDKVKITQNTESKKLAHMKSNTFYFNAQVEEFSGTASFKVTASSGSEMSKDTAQIPIKPATPERAILLSKKPDKKFKLDRDVASEFHPDFVNLDASISSTPYLSQLGNLRHLIRYPYGCLEQTTSSTYPLLAMNDLLEWVDPDIAQKHNIEDMVQRGIDRVLTMQTSEGGFGYWPGDRKSNVWATGYATNMLLDAKKLGYPVPEDAIDGALDYLNYTVGSGRYAREVSSYLKISEPFLLFVLAKGKRSIKEPLKKLANAKMQWGNLTTENNFLMGITARLVNNNPIMRRFITERSVASLAPAGRLHNNSFWSQFRTDGMRLSILEDIWPEHEGTEVIAQRVARKLAATKSYYYSTQDLAWAVSGLGKRVRAYKGTETKNVSFKLNGKTVKPAYTQGKTPVWRFENLDPKNAVFNVNYESEKTPFLYMRVSGHLKDFAAAGKTTGNFDVTRKYYRTNGQEVNLNQIKRGDLIVIGLDLQNSSRNTLENFALVDRIPAGFEIENPRLGRSHKLSWIDDDRFVPDYVDMRDDRVQIFGNLKSSYQGAYYTSFYYIVRAVTEGDFVVPPAKMELMYNPEEFAFSNEQRVKISR